MTAGWSTLEQGIITLLTPRLAPVGPWMTLDVYSVQRGRELSDGARGRLPAALVAIERADYRWANTGKTILHETVFPVVQVIWRHPGTQKQLRHGTTYDEGLYALAYDAIATISDEVIDGWEALLPLRIRQERIDATQTRLSVEFQTARRIYRDDMKGIEWADFVSLYAGIRIDDGENVFPEILIESGD